MTYSLNIFLRICFPFTASIGNSSIYGKSGNSCVCSVFFGGFSLLIDFLIKTKITKTHLSNYLKHSYKIYNS